MQIYAKICQKAVRRAEPKNLVKSRKIRVFKGVEKV